MWRVGRRHREVVAQSLEGGLAHQAPVGQARIGDLGINPRPHPGRLRLVDRRRERRAALGVRNQGLAHLLGHGQAVAALHFSGIDQPVALAAADTERGDAARFGTELHNEGDDGKIVGALALRLAPALAPARTVGRAQMLGNDPFQAELAGMEDAAGAVAYHMLDIDQPVGRSLKQGCAGRACAPGANARAGLRRRTAASRRRSTGKAPTSCRGRGATPGSRACHPCPWPRPRRRLTPIRWAVVSTVRQVPGCMPAVSCARARPYPSRAPIGGGTLNGRPLRGPPIPLKCRVKIRP
jgi:hypothetical protein